MRFLCICGSVGKKSSTRTLLLYLAEILQAEGMEVDFWDLGDKPLPIAIPEYHQNHQRHPHKIVRDFVKAVARADAFVLGSPLYHDSFSGVLKNALDNLPAGAFDHKPVGLVSHSSNVRSCVVPCNALRPIVRSLGGYATHIQIGTTEGDYGLEAGQLCVKNTSIKERIRLLVDEIIRLSILHKQPS